MSNVNRCIACGEIIPEGRQVCKVCEMRANGAITGAKPLKLEEILQMPGVPVYCKEENIYGIIKLEKGRRGKKIPCLVAVYHDIYGNATTIEWDIIKKELQLYAMQASKDIPRSPIAHEMGFGDIGWVCPNCKQGAIVNPYWKNREYYPYCPWCGQKLKED